MSYKQIKWLILLLPPLLMGTWELLRHTVLMPYFSMNAGNAVTPVLLFMIVLALLLPLFRRLEKLQEDLHRERLVKSELEARERLARELHDGIAQSLFLLAVKLDKAEKAGRRGEDIQLDELKRTVHKVNDYVRQSISSLRYPAEETAVIGGTMPGLVADLEQDIPIRIRLDWRMEEHLLTTKEKVELIACIREAVINARKHSGQSEVRIQGEALNTGWRVQITDNGPGITPEDLSKPGKYGLRILQERAAKMGWKVQLESGQGHTTVMIEK
ncbi:sensor histidine kinase [Paenibacillus pinistramenti]|uniref:sensor histidine kinase n=1 Tax=Paenibacillus pinistramenti TaxID=1768003 RepID=UPI00110990E5|nr:histidine kinase [Paenibacillus pinistramenti]